MIKCRGLTTVVTMLLIVLYLIIYVDYFRQYEDWESYCTLKGDISKVPSALIGGEHICNISTHGAEIDTFVLITSACDHFDARESIRMSWLTIYRNNSEKLRYAFVLGNTTNERLRMKIQSENEQNKDILQYDYIDNYSSLTYKTIFAFTWIANNCKQAKNIIKTDDDVYLNVPNMLQTIQNPDNDLGKYILGECSHDRHVVRDKQSKYYISYDVFPFKRYPTFCSGTCYVLSMSAVQEIVNVFAITPYFPLEDVYIAMCRIRTTIGVKAVEGIYSYMPSQDVCFYHSKTFISGHQLSPTQISAIWRSTC